MKENFSRRNMMKAAAGTAAATTGVAAMGSASADYYGCNKTNDSEDYTNPTLNIWFTEAVSCDVGAGSGCGLYVEDFVKGAVQGAKDYASWLEDYAGFVFSVDVNNLTEDTSKHLPQFPTGSDNIEFRNHMQDEIPTTRTAYDTMNLVITSQSNVERLGYSHGDLYEDHHGTLCFVNSQHAILEGVTGYDYGYNMAIHEIAHGQRFTSYMSGGKHHHSTGDPDVIGYYDGAEPTIMATGYAHAIKDGSGATPSFACEAEEWEHSVVPSEPVPEFTDCTVRDILNYHQGECDLIDDTEDLKSRVNVRMYENPSIGY